MVIFEKIKSDNNLEERSWIFKYFEDCDAVEMVI